MGQDGRISSKFLHPGPGFGGSCFPKDTLALVQMGKKFNYPVKTIEAAIAVNEEQSLRMIEKIEYLLDNKISGKKIAVLGLSFKPQTDDIRESSSTKIIPELINKGALVNAYDPVAIENFKIYYPNLSYFESWEDTVKDADVCVILTEWNEFRGIDLEKLKLLMSNPAILDSKNILSIEKLKKLDSNMKMLVGKFDYEIRRNNNP